MVVLAAPPPAQPSPPDDELDPNDPFRYGWRYVECTQPDGTTDWVQVPLSERDILYPQEGDHIAQGRFHHRDVNYLFDVVNTQHGDRPGVVVLSDCGILWPSEESAIAPDITIIDDVYTWDSEGVYDVAEHKAWPWLVIEILSPSTARTDRVEKLERYARHRVQYYIWFERVRGRLRMVAHSLYRDRYERLWPTSQGRVWIRPLDLWLGVADDHPALSYWSGERLLGHRELAAACAEAEERAAAAIAARIAAEQRAEAAAAARVAAEQRVAAAEAQVQAAAEETAALSARLAALEVASRRQNNE